MSALPGKYKDLADETIKLYSEEDERAQVLKAAISWDSYGDAYVTRDELHLIKKYDRKMADKVELLTQHGPQIARILVIFLAKLTKDEDVKYVITLIDDMINMKDTNPEIPNTLSMFNQLAKTTTPNDGVPKLPYGPFFTLLGRKKNEPYILSKTIHSLSSLIVSAHHVEAEVIESAMHWFLEQLKLEPKDEPHYERKVSIALNGLRILMTKNRHRAAFASEGGLKPLIKISIFEENSLNFQRLYESIYCLWLLSFHQQAKQHMVDPKMIYNLCHVSRRIQKDKVVRVAIATLRNLIGVGKNNEMMISYGLPKTVLALQAKKWGDEDIEKDLEELDKELSKGVDLLSSWDRYYNELQSRKLEWSPSHKSERFWSENFLRFEEENFAALRILQEILEKSHDKKVIAIACFDIGQFTRFHPRGKQIIQQLEIKRPLMKLLTDSEEEVRKEALNALQKLMVQNWEYLQ